VQERVRSAVNLYDIFANIIPGVVLLSGVFVPIRVESLVAIQLNAASVLLFVVFAFVVGQAMQYIGSRLDADHGFGQHVACLRAGFENPPIGVTEFDEVFWGVCKRRFRLTDDFDDYSRLFKCLLAELERTGRTRAIRMQALYLFSRGIWVASWMLFVLYVLLGAVVFVRPDLPSDASVALFVANFRGPVFLAFGLLSSFTFGLVFHYQRQEFEKDWITYVIIEFYLDTVSRDATEASTASATVSE
jgi:hypothetical protein